MSNETYVQLIGAVLTIIGALISGYLIPYIKSKLNAKQVELVKEFTRFAVRCAEQIYQDHQYKEKKEYVLEYITRALNNKFMIDLSKEDINIIIEGIVNEVKHDYGTKQIS